MPKQGRARRRPILAGSPTRSWCRSSTAPTWSVRRSTGSPRFRAAGLRYELVLVNDGSSDDSWDVIAERARTTPHVVALNLLRNYGQHNANLAGLREATGDYVITMDDDLQNPPDQALAADRRGHGGPRRRLRPFEQKQAARLPPARQQADRRDQPPDLRHSPPTSSSRTSGSCAVTSSTASAPPARRYPYITGQALMYSSNRANVTGAPRPAPGRQEQLQPGADPAAGLHDPVQLLARIRCGRPRRSASRSRPELPARRRLPGPRRWFATGRPGLDDDVVLLALSTASSSRCSRCSVSTSCGPSTRSARTSRSTSSSGSPVRRHVLVVGAQRCGTTYLARRCSTRIPRSRWRGRRVRSPRSSFRRSPPTRRDGTSSSSSGTPTPSSCWARRAPATSRTRTLPDRAATMLGDAQSSSSCATRSRGRSPTGGSAATTGSSRGRSSRRCGRTSTASRTWDPAVTSVSPVRLPRARPVRRLPGALVRPLPGRPRAVPRGVVADRRARATCAAWRGPRAARPPAPTMAVNAQRGRTPR